MKNTKREKENLQDTQKRERSSRKVSKTAPHEENHYCPPPHQLRKSETTSLNAWTTKKHVAAGTRKGGTRFTYIKSPKVDRTTQKRHGKRAVTRKLGPKGPKLPIGGNVTGQPPRPKLSKNKAINKRPTNKEESPKIEKI
ncbi:hypothetical protein PIB30_024627 [Stylosanthes scabra]|uniref:Uncharacterized protein n=1 Tax=Stylosanthes scabra TaxID=79078 RepID=A0ABU6WDB8_9FABA|nr:hypothetical protein [Stylosanthes scabra]